MKKIFGLTLMVAMFGTMQAHAVSKAQLVGDWKCTSEFDLDNGGKEITVTLDRANADGTMTQLWELVSYDAYGRLEGVEHFAINNRWSVKGNNLRISDFNITDYVAYDRDKSPYDEDKQTYFKQMWADAYKKPYTSKIKFTDKNTFIFPKEGGISNTTCVRLTPNT